MTALRALAVVPLALGSTALAAGALSPRARDGGVGLGTLARDAAVIDVSPARDASACTAALVATHLARSSPTCWLDEPVSSTTGTLRWDCSGDGAAEASFGARRWAGTVRHGVVSLTATTSFPWDDGCRWRSTQTITGSIASRALAFSYHEAPAHGASCAPPCSATAVLELR